MQEDEKSWHFCTRYEKISRKLNEETWVVDDSQPTTVPHGAVVAAEFHKRVLSDYIMNLRLLSELLTSSMESSDLSVSLYLQACFIPEDHSAYSLLNACEVNYFRDIASDAAEFFQGR